ncbi:MAG: hypothetical protein HY735_06655 [Verrucomicrobia bacterium]|nr:hypothetical protein [Verrucomicrobiota bacterium]
MSELGNKIKALRGVQSQIEFAKHTKLSLRTICKLEAGDLVRLATVQQIAKACKLSEPDRLDLIVAWLKLEIGEDIQNLQVEVQGQPLAARDAEYLPAKIQALVSTTPRKYQEQICLALQRPEVLRCLSALNELYDSLHKSRVED